MLWSARVREFFTKHGAVLLILLPFVLVLVLFAGNGQVQLQELREERKLMISMHERQVYQLNQVVTTLNSERVSLTERVASLETKLTETSKREARDEVVEKFDVASGRLIERRAVSTRSKQTEKTQVAVQTQRQTKKLEEKQTQKRDERNEARETDRKLDRTEESKVVATYSPAKFGVGIGMLATPTGVGPAISYRLATIGKVGIDAVGGSAPAPRIGAQLSTEALQSVTVGVGAFAGFGGTLQDIKWGEFDVVPGVTIQYRF